MVDKLLVVIGRLTGLVGLMICGVAVIARASGAFWIGSFQVGSLLQGGIAALLLGCFSLLVALSGRHSRAN